MNVRSVVPLYLGFAATGVAVALPGAILPALLVRWHLHDEQAGRLFLLAWIGSSLGALAVRGSPRVNIAIGSLATGGAAAGLALSSTWSTGVAAGIAVLMLVYGLGLGLVMTAISILRQRQTGMLPGGSGIEMVRLNLMWAAGACAAPSLALHALASGRLAAVLWTPAAGFLALALWTVKSDSVAEPAGVAMHAAETTRALERGSIARGTDFGSLFRLVPLPLILMTALTTGVEASAGGWLATYARRGGMHLGGVVEAPTCLWAGLLLSRLVWSFAPVRSPQHILRGSLILMSIATLLLVAPHIAAGNGVLLLAAAFLLGFGIGPTYPMLLGLTARFQQGGAIFFLAGVASACLPWLTGLFSQRSNSLRTGFVVPLAATLFLVVLSWASPLGSWAGSWTGSLSGSRVREGVGSGAGSAAD